MPFLPNIGGGKTFPQVFCAPYGSPLNVTRPLFTDDVIYGVGALAKTALFQLVVLLENAVEANSAIQAVADVAKVQMSQICVREATYLVVGSATNDIIMQKGAENVWRLVHGNEYNADIWRGLPEPLGYDASRLRRDVKERYIILRPDRVIFAACKTVDDFAIAMKELEKFLGY